MDDVILQSTSSRSLRSVQGAPRDGLRSASPKMAYLASYSSTSSESFSSVSTFLQRRLQVNAARPADLANHLLVRHRRKALGTGFARHMRVLATDILALHEDVVGRSQPKKYNDGAMSGGGTFIWTCRGIFRAQIYTGERRVQLSGPACPPLNLSSMM